MKKNHLFTLSYFRKRLRDAAWQSVVLQRDFPDEDSRYWHISIGDACVWCTCFRTEDDCWFMFSDGKNLIKYDKIIRTESINVITEYLDQLMERN